MTLISVALPVMREAELLEGAAGCMLGQTLRDIELLIVCNGSDERTLAVAQGIAERDRRARVVRVAEAGLARALNVALREAKGDLVARMDVDDWCPPERLEVQAEYLRARPGLAGVGCWYDVVGPAGEALFTVRPPEEPGEVRWRLLIQNMLAHGSMLLRRGSVLEAGGYDEEWTKAQDYELWLRLTRRWGLGAVQRVLYRHVVRDASDPMRGRGEQSRLAVRAMVREWALLPEGGAECERALAQAGSLEASRSEIERALAAGASRAGLMAWLWAGHASLATPARAVGVARRALVREVGAGLKADGVKGVWLWGAGDHTRKVLEHAEDFGVPVLGIVDDRVRGERFGLRVVGPESLSGSEVVVLSSDWHEAELWEASKASRDRGVRVVRLYA